MPRYRYGIMMRRFGSASRLPLALAVAALVGACSSSSGTTNPGSPASTPSGGEPAAEASPGPAKRSSSTPALAGTVAPEIVSTLRGAGFELDALPELESLHETGHPRMRAIMKTFTIALGTTCDGCHIANAESDEDFRVDTPRKKVARQMYARFVGELQKKGGGAIYCDTCHQGSIKFLDRSNDDALASWMQDNLVDRLERKDGNDHACATCHGEPFAGPMLGAWRK